VSSFVGDQFVKGQEAMLGMVFAMFYFCINAGSLASTIITPLLREHTTVRTVSGCWLSHRSTEHLDATHCVVRCWGPVLHRVRRARSAVDPGHDRLLGRPPHLPHRTPPPVPRRGHETIQTSHMFGILQVPPGANMTNILFGALAVRTPLPSCVLRVACCVLRAACCVLRAAC
jgi:hypothetical protein